MVDPEDLSSGTHFQSHYLEMSPMGENATPREPEEQAAKTRRPSERSREHQRQDRFDLLRELHQPTHYELGLLYRELSGHRWNA